MIRQFSSRKVCISIKHVVALKTRISMNRYQLQNLLVGQCPCDRTAFTGVIYSNSAGPSTCTLSGTLRSALPPADLPCRNLYLPGPFTFVFAKCSPSPSFPPTNTHVLPYINIRGRLSTHTHVYIHAHTHTHTISCSK